MDKNDVLLHYGTPRHSGRYPWGSGENPYQHEKGFQGYVNELKKQGLTESTIAKSLNITTKELRARVSIAKDEKRMADAAEALRLKNKGYSNVAIGKRMGINESSVRSLLDPALKLRSETTKNTAEMLKRELKKKGMLDVGTGVERYIDIGGTPNIGISRDKLDTALVMLKDEGYTVHNILVQQMGTGKYTTVRVLAPEGTTAADVYKNKDKIGSIAEWSTDGGKSFNALEKPRSVSSDRIQVRYAEDGGTKKDGVIELRRGVEDISLGNARYAQVRIAVDDSHYLKGMAIYSDDLPKGVDIVFNTNKHKGTPMLGSKDNTVLKPLHNDEENPFKTLVRQRKYVDKNGKEQLSCLNIVNEEGTWEGWDKNLASQVLSKQPTSLAKKQLALAYDSRSEQFDEIKSYTNPVVKQELLKSFAESCDSDSVYLKAAAMPRQATHVILPLSTIKDNEIYAPRYKNGERVVLIRFPHAGQFEIPELVVNNKNPEGKRIITNDSKDAVGINHRVAEILSGADFDGDTVLVIPNNKREIKTKPQLQGLKDFDPKEMYPKVKGMKVIGSEQKQIEMGKVSNLITDMTIKGAKEEEIAAAVRHSMVVIDAEKHELNYKQSEIDNRIAELSRKYQDGGGASTIISRAKSPEYVETRKYRGVDKETGEEIYVPSNKMKRDKNGKMVPVTVKSTKMAETKDARTLLSDNPDPIEIVYADHANKLKALANEARKYAANMELPRASQSAKNTYAAEVASLNAKLNNALKNDPLERQAQILANVEVASKMKANPSMDKDDKKKLKNQSLERARLRVGAKKERVDITDKEWEAIQAGAISSTKLRQIIKNADEEKIKKLASPRETVGMTPAKTARARAMLNAGCTLAEVAEILGVSVSTVSRSV